MGADPKVPKEAAGPLPGSEADSPLRISARCDALMPLSFLGRYEHGGGSMPVERLCARFTQRRYPNQSASVISISEISIPRMTLAMAKGLVLPSLLGTCVLEEFARGRRS